MHAFNNSTKLNEDIAGEITNKANCGNYAAKCGKERISGSVDVSKMKFTL
jgi:hypothetical protein